MKIYQIDAFTSECFKGNPSGVCILTDTGNVNEDPVTGSAHSYLAPYWYGKLNKKVLNAYQASKHGGEIQYELTTDKRVLLRWKGVTIFEIEIEKKSGQPEEYLHRRKLFKIPFLRVCRNAV